MLSGGLTAWMSGEKPTNSSLVLRPFHKMELMTDTVSWASNQWLIRSQVLGKNPIPFINLLNEQHSIKLLPKFVFLFPWVSASLNPHQRSFFLQLMAVEIWIRNAPLVLWHLNTWSPLVALFVEVWVIYPYWRRYITESRLWDEWPQATSSSPSVFWRCRLSAPSSCCHACHTSPTWWTHSSVTVSLNKLSFLH